MRTPGTGEGRGGGVAVGGGRLGCWVGLGATVGGVATTAGNCGLAPHAVSTSAASGRRSRFIPTLIMPLEGRVNAGRPGATVSANRRVGEAARQPVSGSARARGCGWTPG